MASIIEGYNYDIFISYRQKDNKHDGWVSEFVNNLKGELESTFKEEISVYFDINPHDGLLETHDVDSSLKEKLKCLIFIPIISRTYCDPKSFAWEHEFKAFVEQASNDKFGLKVKLPSGNVANRILPVQIHDLDTDDKKLVEGELGGHLRGIEFIYKELGVNRPLIANEDHPDNNLNKTFYRNQINKVANAIKEVITAIKKYGTKQEEVSQGVSISISTVHKNNKTTIIAGLVIALFLIILGFFFVPKLIKPKEQLEKSIAVLPFKSLSTDPEKQYQADGIMDAITLHLSKIKDLRVLGRTSTEQYRNPTKTSTKIGNELGVNYLLEGSFQNFGDNAKLIVQLIKTGKEGHAWGNEYNINMSEVFTLQINVAQTIARELNVAITPSEKQLIEKTPTTSLTAYDFYQRGKEEYLKYWNDKKNKEALNKAENFYNKAIEYDSTFAQAYVGLAWIWGNKHYWDNFFSSNFLDSVQVLADIALSFDKNLAEAFTCKGGFYRQMGNPEQALKEFEKAIKLNPNDWITYNESGILYSNFDLVKSIENFNKAVSLNRGVEQLSTLLKRLSNVYSMAGFSDIFKKYLMKAFKLDEDSLEYFYCLSCDEWYNANFTKRLEIDKKSYTLDSTEYETLYNIGYDYMILGKQKESLEYFKKWLEKSETLTDSHIFGLHRVGWAYWQNGYKKEAEYYFNKQIENCIKMNELGRILGDPYRTFYDLAGVYAFRGEKDKVYDNLRIFNNRQMTSLMWISLFKTDPLFNNIRNDPEFQQIVRIMETKYQAEHERVRKWLEENNML